MVTILGVLRIWRVHFTVALLVGLVLGTCLGIGEGVSVLLSQGVLGRYNELVAWAIAVDAAAMIAVEFGLAILSGLILFLVRLVPSPRRLMGRQIRVGGCSLAPRGRWTGTRPYATSQTHRGRPLVVTSPQAHPVGALVSLQLGETVFILALAWGIWSQGTVNPSLFRTNPLGAVWPPGVAGLALGELVLAGSMWITEHAPVLRRLHARDWLILEGVVLVLAIAFGFTR